MVIASDITPRRQAEELAAQQAERAQTASSLITMGEMASSVAHELNQPLTAISNYCSGMISRIQAKQVKEEDLLWALEKTAHQAQRAGQIILRIRSFVKRSEPNRTLSDVSAMVSESLELAEIENDLKSWLKNFRLRCGSWVEFPTTISRDCTDAPTCQSCCVVIGGAVWNKKVSESCFRKRPLAGCRKLLATAAGQRKPLSMALQASW
jgi:signal transduction histidine kinase